MKQGLHVLKRYCYVSRDPYLSCYQPNKLVDPSLEVMGNCQLHPDIRNKFDKLQPNREKYICDWFYHLETSLKVSFPLCRHQASPEHVIVHENVEQTPQS